MCGIAGLFGPGWSRPQLEIMAKVQSHRGPDDCGIFIDQAGQAGLAHNRLSIIDLSPGGHQPMQNAAGNLHIAFNGEIYNFLELRAELSDYPFRGNSDTEVILAAYERWGEACLDRFLGMFAFLIWDRRERRLFAARDRFGVKPLYYSIRKNGAVWLSSEIRALHAAGVPVEADESTWATYLSSGLHDHSEGTFWRHVQALEPGHILSWEDGETDIRKWYDLAERTGPHFDERSTAEVSEHYGSLLEESIRLRFRSDVEVAINISGGLDSSTLLGLVHKFHSGSPVKAFTYTTGDEHYDELPWVRRMVEHTGHELIVCQMTPQQVPYLAASVQAHQDEPFGGLPNLAYARLFETARESGVKVLLDGQGMDEQWAGYDYYERLSNPSSTAPLQGTHQRAVLPECLAPDFLSQAKPFRPSQAFPDALRSRQYLDARHTKIPRTLRFNDRVSMRSSTELREPFMDHRLFELALRQPPDRKIHRGVRKWLLRNLTRELLPCEVVEAPKRPVQTPQREWLAGPLRDWAHDCIETASDHYRDSWFKSDAMMRAWEAYCGERPSNSFYVWQWISVGLMLQNHYEAGVELAQNQFVS